MLYLVGTIVHVMENNDLSLLMLSIFGLYGRSCREQITS